MDHVLTNMLDLFVSTAVILPAGTKRRKHRKQNLYLALAEENWDSVLNAQTVDCTVNNLETHIHKQLDSCMPFRSVCMSSHDPIWMTPLVKSLLRVNQECLKLAIWKNYMR